MPSSLLVQTTKSFRQEQWLLIVVTATCIGSGIAWSLMARWSRGHPLSENGDDDIPTTIKVISYPWEPSQKNEILSSTHKNEVLRQTTSSGQPNKALDFLSSMTFANGGLRAPNCPCCI